MNNMPWVRPFAAACMCFLASVATAQDPPVAASPPAAEAPASPPETAPPQDAVPTPGTELSQAAAAEEPASPDAPPLPGEAPPLEGAALAPEPAVSAESPAVTEPEPMPAPNAKRIVVLPVEFTVYEKSVAGLEAVPDWTKAAQQSLGNAADMMLEQDNRFAIVPMPEINPEMGSFLREHVELFKIIAGTVAGVVQYGGKAWEEKKANFDYSLGDGLVFFADTVQADFALIIGGQQVKQTGGSVFMQVLAAAGGYAVAGGGTYVMAGIVDLRSGDVTWFNTIQGGEFFGATSSDVRDPVTAQILMAKMFEGYPGSKFATFRAP